MLEMGMIEQTNGPWGAPELVVKQKSAEFLMVVDHHKIYAVTEGMTYPLPRIKTLCTLWEAVDTSRRTI